MAEDKTEAEVSQEELDDLVQEGGEEKSPALDKNTKLILIGALVILLGIGGYWAYNKFVVEPAEIAAYDEIWWAENMLHFKEDTKAAIEGDTLGFNNGFEYAIDKTSGTQAGKIAKYNLGISYMNEGEYDAAIAMLEGVDFEDEMVSTVAKGAIGDCYMQKNDAASAITYYEQAIQNSENNFTCPLYLKKCAFAHETLGQWNDAIAHYERIKKDFPDSQTAVDIDKYIVKAKASV